MTTENITPNGTFAVSGFLCGDLLKLIDLIPNKGIWASQKIRLVTAIGPLYESFTKAHNEILNELCDKDADGKPVTKDVGNGMIEMSFKAPGSLDALNAANKKLVIELPISVDVKTNAPIKAALVTLRNIFTGEQCPEIPADKFSSFASIIGALDIALTD
jgi:hypothetical protein